MPIQDDSEEDGSLTIFGSDVSQIPCFRKTFLRSIPTGIGVGLLYFLFTSKVRMATHVAVNSFFVVTFGYWFYCGYQYSQNKFLAGQMQQAFINRVVYEGTAMEDRFNEEEAKLGKQYKS